MVNIGNQELVEKVTWFLEHLKKDGLEITSIEDLEDLKTLKSTRQEETITFENHLNNAN